MEEKRKDPSRKFLIVLIIVIVVFIVSAAGFFSTLYNLKKERSAFNELAQMVTVTVPETSDISADIIEKAEPPKYTEDGFLIKYDGLRKLNPDMIGWITVRGTEINYPVMYRPEDPEYYLYRAFDGSPSKSGTPFIAAGCTPESSVILIHGHNMKNGTMFGSLDKYADKSFWEQVPTFTFDTLTEERTYEVIGVLRSRVLNVGEEGFRYYNMAGDLTESEFNELYRQFKDNGIYDTGVEAQYGDRLIMLSTCAYHTENGRLVVLAKQIENQ